MKKARIIIEDVDTGEKFDLGTYACVSFSQSMGRRFFPGLGSEHLIMPNTGDLKLRAWNGRAPVEEEQDVART